MNRVARIAGSALLMIAMLAGAEPAPTYLTGGSKPLPEAQQARLNRHAAKLTLGLNVDWMEAAQIDSEPVTRAIDLIGQAVDRGQANGAVFLVDRLQQHTMPVGVGFRITSPEKRPVEYSTLYELHDLTGPLMTSFLAVSLVAGGTLKPDAKVGDLLLPLNGTPNGQLTVEDLLRRRSKLAPAFPEGVGPANRDELIRALATWPRTESNEGPSPAELLLLGLIVEKVSGKPFREAAETDFRDYLQLQTVEWGIDATKRFTLAPGGMNPWLGHMAWGDPREPFAKAFGTPAPHWGLTCSADDLAILARIYMAIAIANQGIKWDDATPAARLVIPPADGHPVGYAFQSGRFGARSFGWDSPLGNSFWVLPEVQGFLVFLTNADHPTGNPDRGNAVRDEVVPLLAESLMTKWAPTPVDSPKSPDNTPTPSKGNPPAATP